MCAALVLLLCGAKGAAAKTTDPPNIIVVSTDDQPAREFTRRVMPTAYRVIVRHGTKFDRDIAPTPLCAPSRAALLTGEYGHNNGVTWNIPGYGDLQNESSTLPVWLNRAGYRTVHIGKYVNLYNHAVDDPAAVPPGWTDWHTMVDPTRYYGFTYNENGIVRTMPTIPAGYATTVFNREAVSTIREMGSDARPLFMIVDQFAPHEWPGVGRVAACPPPAPQPSVGHAGLFAKEPLPSPPSFDEADTSDKPAFIRDRPPLDADQIAQLTTGYRCGLAALRSVDDGIGEIWKALGKEGERRNTAIIFTSDNGFYSGEHRIDNEKQLPYREGLEVPLAIRLPPDMSEGAGTARAGTVVHRPVANVDVTASILQLAGARPCLAMSNCRPQDGHSLVPLARGRTGDFPRRRPIPIELNVGERPGRGNSVCAYRGVWKRDETFVTYTSEAVPGGGCVPSQESEYYDLGQDPYELSNGFPAPAGSLLAVRQSRLSALADRLSTCEGTKHGSATGESSNPCP